MRIDLPSVGHVVVVAPVGRGKSALLSRIARVLREEFGARVVFDTDERPAEIPKWEADLVSSTVWVLDEVLSKESLAEVPKKGGE